LRLADGVRIVSLQIQRPPRAARPPGKCTMKLRLLTAIAGLALIATPALAASTTVEFVNSSGQTTVVVFDTNGTAVINGAAPGPYTIDQTAKKICGDAGGQQLCVTFGEMGTDVGFSTTYTDTAGNSGTATITAVSN
jgi:hypothetical protein